MSDPNELSRPDTAVLSKGLDPSDEQQPQGSPKLDFLKTPYEPQASKQSDRPLRNSDSQATFATPEPHPSPRQRESKSTLVEPENPSFQNVSLSEKGQVKQASTDIFVTWDGEDDPANPRNWSESRAWWNIGIISVISTVTPLAAAILSPSIPQIMEEFNSTNEALGAFAVSVYILGFALGPLLLSPLSEVYGRLIIYHICGVLFVIFNVACALSTSMPMLTAFRFLAGAVGSCPITNGGGSIADMRPPQKRGTAMAIQAFGGMMGPAIGPIAGAFLSQNAGWRWVVWLVTILGGVTAVAGAVIMRETYAPVLLKQKAARLRKETGNPSFKAESDDQNPLRLVGRAVLRPAKLLCFSPVTFIMSILMGMAYGLMYLLYTTISIVFEDQYGFSTGLSGVAYLGAGVGTFIGLFLFMRYSDKITIKLSKKTGPKPEYRLPPLIYGYWAFPAGFFIFGWTAQYHTHWIVPIIGNAITGAGVMSVYLPVQIYLVDCYPAYAASSLAAVSFFRSILGAFLPLAGNALFDDLGLGWGGSVLGFISLAFYPVCIGLWFWGERFRNKFPVTL